MVSILSSHLPLFFGMPNGTELVVVLIIVLIIFGPRQLPKIGRALGGGIKEFKDGLKTGYPDDDEKSEPDKSTTTVEALPPNEASTPDASSAPEAEESRQTPPS